MSQFKVNLDLTSLVYVGGLAGAGALCWYLYSAHVAKELESKRQQEAEAAKYEEFRKRTEAENEAARLKRVEEQKLNAELRRQEAEQRRLQAETERNRVLAEREEIKAKEEAARKKAEEEARLAREAEERKAAELAEAERKRQEDAAAQARMDNIEDARKAFKVAVAELPRLEAQLKDKQNAVTACKNRIEGALKTQAGAQTEAIEWARKSGVVVSSNHEFSWSSIYSNYGDAAGSVKMVQDNREQIAKCKAKYDSAAKEIEQCMVAQKKAEAEIPDLEGKIVWQKTMQVRSKEFLKQQGEDVTPLAKIEAKSAFPVYKLKDGRALEAKRVMEVDDTYAIQTPDGKTETVKKDDVVEINKP